MFQNITDDLKQEDVEDVKENRSRVNISGALKRIFKFQNLLIYIVSFLVSTVSINNGWSIFGISMVAAACGSLVPAGIVVLTTGLGTLLGLGLGEFFNFLETVLVFIALVVIFKPKVSEDERNEVNKVGKHVFFASIIVSIAKCFIGILLKYDLINSLVGSALIYVFYKIFVNAIIVLKDFKEKEAFSIEELIGTSLMLSIAAFAFNGLVVYGFSISNVLCIALILILGWKNGPLLGGTTGITIGMALGIIGVISPVQIAAYSVAGFVAGLLYKFGKIGVILGFILGNVILTYIAKTNISTVMYFREILIASLLLIAMPRKLEINIQDLIGRTKFLTDIGERRLTENKDTIEKLSKMSKTIDGIAQTFNIEKEDVDITKGEIKEEFIDTLLAELDNIDSNILYDDLIQTGNGIIYDIYEILIKNEIVIEKDIIKIFEEHNNFIVQADSKIKNDLQEVVKIINRTYRLSEVNHINKQKIAENKRNVSKQLAGVSKAINNVAEDLNSKEESKYSVLEERITEVINEKVCKLKDCNIKRNSNEKYIVDLEFPIEINTSLREKSKTKTIENIISKIIGESITFQRDKKDVKNNRYVQLYSSEDPFIMQVGTAKLTKEGSNASGDSNLQIRLDDGKYLLLISDGMGSGEKARNSSQMVVKMINDLLSAGFEKETTIDLINSTLKLNYSEDMYATIDMAILDLFKGEAEFIKTGACKTYIKNKKNIEKVSSKTLPIGMLNNLDVEKCSTKVKNGDIIVMCSDGVIDSGENNLISDWMEDLLKGINTNNVQKIADLIISEAVDNSYGIAKDDMTVIVAKVISNKE